MTLKEHIAIFLRGVKEMYRMAGNLIVPRMIHNILSAAVTYVPIWFSAKLVDALYAGESRNVLIVYAALTVGLVFLLKLMQELAASKNNANLDAIWIGDDWNYSEKAMSMAYTSMEDREVSMLRERIKIEAQTGYHWWMLLNNLDAIVHHGTKLLLSLFMMGNVFFLESVPVGWKLILLAGVAATIVVGAWSAAGGEKVMLDFFSGCTGLNLYGKAYEDYVNAYSTGMEVRLYDMSEQLAKDMRDINGSLQDNYIKAAWKQVIIKLPDVLANHVLKYGIYAFLIYAAVSGTLSVGAIARYVSCMMLFVGAVSDLVRSVQATAVNNEYLKHYFSYFDIPNNMYQGSLTVEKRDDNEYFVEFKDVSFKYPNTEVYALRHVNLKFKVGEKLAVVGKNGSGKTTFIKLLCRLYDPTEGQILLNGVDIKKYDYDEYMSIFSVVFQDFNLFAFTLGQNVAAAKEYNKSKVEECLKKAGFGERLAVMPEGPETYLYKAFSGDGVEISGGEAQKIALARALYKDAPFIVLDEPTAALDPISEYEVYSKFNEIAGDKTAIYISHRLASCRFCDNILVFDNGNVVQHGNHETLLADTNGTYQELWHAQAQYYV